MISRSSVAAAASQERMCTPSMNFSHTGGHRGLRTVCRANHSRITTSAEFTQRHSSRRDQLLAAAAFCPAAQLLLNVAAARADDRQRYTDPQDAFELTVPAGWVQTETALEGNASFRGSSGARRTVVWYSPDTPADQVNVTLTITNTSVEFTRLGSFGNVYTFGQNLVNSMDQRFLLRVRGAPASQPVQVARLEDAAEHRGMYFVEYSIEKQPTGPKRHLYSLVALAYNGRYNRLYTLTAQCLEEQVEQAEPVLRQILDSFVPPAGGVA